MAKTLNRVALLGNVGKAPEVKVTNGGTKVAKLSIATVNRFKDRQDKWQESTEWHYCVAFGSLAEILEKYVGKGSKIYIEGRLATDSWEDRNTGEKRYKTKIIVSDVTLLGAPQGSARNAAPDDETTVPGYAYTRDTQITDDDIPF